MAFISLEPFHFSRLVKQAFVSCAKREFVVAFPESLDSRILQASAYLLKYEIVKKVIFFTSKHETLAKANKNKIVFDHDQLIWFSPSCKQIRFELEDFLRNRWLKKGKKKKEIQLACASPLYQSAYLLHQNKCQLVMGGCVYTTAEVIRAGLDVLGLGPKSKIVSGSFLLERGESQLLFADCGVIVNPTSENLVDIACESVKTWQCLQSLTCMNQKEPVVAFLSFSTKKSAHHQVVDKIAKAAASFKRRYPQIMCDGEIQFDAAYDDTLRCVKAPESTLKKPANIFIFPNLDAANIAYKITQRLAGFQAYGPILQGLAKPYSDLSRGAFVSDVIASTAINLLRQA